MTFGQRRSSDLFSGGFGALQSLNENILRPGAGFWLRRQHSAEVITYVLEGAVSHGDADGGSDLLYTGEFQCLAATRGVRHSETNPSRTEQTHLVQLWLRPSAPGLEPGHEHRRFAAGERHGVLCPVASPDGRDGSLRLHQDTTIYSAILDSGTHLVHALQPRRSAWLHVVRGEVALGEHLLSTGDGAGVVAGHTVSITARGAAEILLVDVLAAEVRSGANARGRAGAKPRRSADRKVGP